MIHATFDNVLVKPVYEQISDTIVLAETAEKSTGNFYGIVVAVGPTYPDPSLKVGDKILYTRIGNVPEGIDIDIDGVAYTLLKEKWVLGRVEE